MFMPCLLYVQSGHGWHKHKVLADSIAESLSLNMLMPLFMSHVPTRHNSDICTSRRTMQGFDILMLNNGPMHVCKCLCPAIPAGTY